MVQESLRDATTNPDEDWDVRLVVWSTCRLKQGCSRSFGLALVARDLLGAKGIAGFRTDLLLLEGVACDRVRGDAIRKLSVEPCHLRPNVGHRSNAAERLKVDIKSMRSNDRFVGRS